MELKGVAPEEHCLYLVGDLPANATKEKQDSVPSFEVIKPSWRAGLLAYVEQFPFPTHPGASDDFVLRDAEAVDVAAKFERETEEAGRGWG
jgi:hypothetical protein